MKKMELNTLKILIVDDEAIIRKGMETIIRKWSDFQVVGVADDGETALSWLSKSAESPDLMITDIFMQYMDGLELIKRVNQLYPQIKCAILSGHEDFELARRAIRLKVCRYITKPIEPEELFTTLKELEMEIKCERSYLNHRIKNEQDALDGIGFTGGKLEICKQDSPFNPEDIIEKAIQYMHQNYGNSSLSLHDIAEFVSIHPNYLTQLFTKRMGMPCIQFLTQIRMEKAKEILKQPNIRISDVAKSVGYENPLYFSSYFKKWVGVNPSTYREVL